MRVMVFALLSAFTLGCTRPEPKSTVRIQMPDGASLLKSIKKQAAVPAEKKICFGVSVSGSGIATSSGITCTGVGLYAGFVAEGETLAIDNVTRGERTFELLAYLQDTNSACPPFELGTMSSATSRSLLYSAGKTTINIEGDTTVPITMTMPTESLADTICPGSQSLKAKLLSNGDLIDAAGTVLAESSQTNEGYFQSPYVGPLSLGLITSGGYVNIATDNLKVPPSVRSMTQKPDTGEYYALRHDNVIVKLVVSAGILSIVDIAAGACPFDVPNCQVPIWMQSISAGYSTDLFGLDHAGTIYNLKASGPVATSSNVGPTVTQVSYY